MTITLDGTTGITSPNDTTGNQSYTGTLTGGTGVVNLGSGQFYKDASGNVGIGTSSPRVVGTNYTALELYSSTTGSSIWLSANANTYNGYLAVDSGSLNLTAITSLPVTFGTNNTERMRIDSSGNVLIGQTTIAASTVGASVSPSGVFRAAQSSSTNGTSCYDLYSTGAGTYRFYVGLGGTIFATSIVISAISDERLKENIKDIDTGLGTIMALKPRRFDWKAGKGQDKKNVAGFIAQEFETVFPECVSTTKAGEDGIEYKNINHETLIPTLVKAIQELKAEVDSLKQQLGK